MRQKNVIQLLIRPHQMNMFEEQAEIGNSYELEANLKHYRNPQEVKRFLSLYKHGHMLPRGEVFSVLYKEHVYQLERVFDLLFLAKDYDTFFKTACWARDRINHGMFVLAFSVAVIQRDDTRDIILPPPYEVYPELFVDTTVIQQAYEARMRNQKGPVIIYHNFTSNINNYHDLLNYFTEDVGLSTYNTYLNYEYPIWMDLHKYGMTVQRRGEIFYYTRQQLLARYQMERLSNGLPGVETFHVNIHKPVMAGLNPHLRYRNGQEVPIRPEGMSVRDNDIAAIEEVKNIERRIQDAIDSGTFLQQTAEGPKRVFLKDLDVMDVLGNIIQGNKCSLNRKYFKSIYAMVLSLYGHMVDPKHTYGVAPGALEHFETAIRDPVYFGITKRVVQFFEMYKNQLKSYTRDELVVPGVKIESVDVDKIITYFDDFEFNLNNAMDVSTLEEAEQLDIRVRQQRLNHKPISAHITVNSEKNMKVLVRAYVAPKFDYLGRELTLDEKRHYMVELDRFPYEVVAGQNVIERNSRDSNAIVHDQLITSVLLKKVNDALEGKEPLYIGSTYRHCGFPERLLMPRGTKDGLPLTLYVVLTPYEAQDLNFHPSVISCGPGINYQDVDNKSLGYPFDRIIYEPHNFAIPNFYEKDIMVFHRTQEEINKA
ncbi:hexamerin [Anabrus simplex]|uniref:hexamerin n=1 Tax=Anabrus simplex TaxID=316456 RepID=UPI0034DCD570